MYGHTRTYRTHLAALAGLCLALFSVPSLAITIDLGPSDFRTFGPNGTHYGAGIRTMRSVPMGGVINTLPRPMNLPATVNRPTVIPYRSVAQGLKTFTRVNPASIAASAAVTGLFLAVDWVFDHDMGEWVVISENTLEDPEVSIWTNSNLGISAPTPDIGCELLAAAVSPPAVYSSYTLNTGATQANCRGTQYGANVGYGSLQRRTDCPEGYYIDFSLGVCVAAGLPTPLTESDWSDLESSLPSSNPDEVSTAAGDAMRRLGNPLSGYEDLPIEGPSQLSGPTTTSTTTNPSTGQSVVTEQQTVTRFSYSPESITVTESTTTTNYSPDGSVESETVTETSPGDEVITDPGTAPGDWPGFCDWATVVCDWLNWTQDGWDMQEPEGPQLVDFEPDGDFDMGAGSGECPAPFTITIGFVNQTVEVSYQPFCDLAIRMNGLFLAFCYLFAGVITVRSL